MTAVQGSVIRLAPKRPYSEIENAAKPNVFVFPTSQEVLRRYLQDIIRLGLAPGILTPPGTSPQISPVTSSISSGDFDSPPPVKKITPFGIDDILGVPDAKPKEEPLTPPPSQPKTSPRLPSLSPVWPQKTFAYPTPPPSVYSCPRKEIKSAKKVAKKRNSSVSSMIPNFRYMTLLGEIRRQRHESGIDYAKMTECRLCGGCSFSQSKAVAFNYMAQHLYTHLSTAMYSCGLCEGYASSWKPRVQTHIKNNHGISLKDSFEYVKDRRYELDTRLCELAVQCFGEP